MPRIHPILTQPDLLFGCERIPVAVLAVSSLVLLVAGFGISLTGIVCCTIVFATGLNVLRKIAVYDPLFFKIFWRRLYPMRIPNQIPARAVFMRSLKPKKRAKG